MLWLIIFFPSLISKGSFRKRPSGIDNSDSMNIVRTKYGVSTYIQVIYTYTKIVLTK